SSRGSYEDRTIQASQKIHDTALASLEYPRACHAHRDTPRLHALHRGAQPEKNEAIQRKAIWIRGQCRLEPLCASYEQMQLRAAACSSRLKSGGGLIVRSGGRD